MSFQRSSALEAQPTTFRREDDPQYRDDPEYDALTTSLSDKLFSLTSNITQLGRQVALLGTRRENERVRERVQDLLEETGAGFKDVGEGLKKVSTWRDLGPAQKYTQGKLNSEFRNSLGEFQVLQRTALQKQKEAQSAALSAQAASNDPSSQSQQQQQQLLQEQIRLAPQSEVDFQDSLIIEREAEIRQIEQSVGELNELFRNVNTIVQEQGVMLTTIEDNVVRTLEDTRGADRELRVADRYQRSSRSKACCLLLVLAVVLIVIVLAVVIG